MGHEVITLPIITQILALIILGILLVACFNKAIEQAIDNEREAIVKMLRGFAADSQQEDFKILPEHIDGLADEIEGGLHE